MESASRKSALGGWKSRNFHDLFQVHDEASRDHQMKMGYSADSVDEGSKGLWIGIERWGRAGLPFIADANRRRRRKSETKRRDRDR